MNKVYLDELESIGNELVNYSKNEISSKIDELKNLTNNLEWNGMGYETFIEGYNNRINKIIEWNDNLTRMASFLLTAKDDYTDTNENIESKYNENLEELMKELAEMGRY